MEIQSVFVDLNLNLLNINTNKDGVIHPFFLICDKMGLEKEGMAYDSCVFF